MSAVPVVDQTPTNASSKPQTIAEARLVELKRALQRQLRRKPNAIEKAALDRAALMSVRAEIAAYDPRSTSEDVVRLDNAARRARLDFEKLARIGERKPKAKTMADIEAEVRAHG